MPCLTLSGLSAAVEITADIGYLRMIRAVRRPEDIQGTPVERFRLLRLAPSFLNKGEVIERQRQIRDARDRVRPPESRLLDAALRWRCRLRQDGAAGFLDCSAHRPHHGAPCRESVRGSPKLAHTTHGLRPAGSSPSTLVPRLISVIATSGCDSPSTGFCSESARRANDSPVA